MNWLKPRQARLVFFLQRQPQIFQITTLVARQREYSRGFGGIFCCWPPSKKCSFICLFVCKKKCFNTHESTGVLSTGVIKASCHALRRVLSKKVIWVLGQCWVNTPHIHTSEWESLFFQSCLLSIVTVTQSNSDHVNRRAALQRFRLEFTFFRLCTRYCWRNMVCRRSG